MARAAGGNDLLQSAETNAEGRYVLAGLPRTRISVGASRRGYVAQALAGAQSRLILDLAVDEAVSGADFDLLPGGVITGRITDQAGEPLEGVQVAPWHITHFGGRHRAPTGAGAVTDDRGVYRIFGLEPGRYILLARPTRLNELLFLPLYYPGRSEENRAEEIEVRAASEVAGIDVTFGAETSYRLAGKIAEVDRERLGRITVDAMTADRAVAARSAPDPEGNFSFEGLPGGGYIVTAYEQRFLARRQQILARQTVELSANVAGLLLHPGRRGSLAGAVGFAVSGRLRAKPLDVRIRVTNRDDLETAETAAPPPDYKFEFPDLWPGAYTIELVSPPNAYLQRVLLGNKALEPPEVMVPEGAAATVRLAVAFDFARLRGVVKAPGGAAPLPQARVALAEPGGSPVRFRTVQADQRGRWFFDRVRPGDYRLCAWPAIESDALYAPEIWQRAGRAVKQVAIEPSADVEVDLTAAAAEPAP
ncbi:MAG TPA: carboxypeptidase-like regulatory domain-containing protein [Bryobacterales bacterium]|nr:carboxypeptidase-like regulatory domain-containing protein [Bryobacterales bacterium]